MAANGKVVPLVIIRPSIIAASFSEPFPGWTDRLGLLGGLYSIGGHGVLRDLPLNPKLIGDQIPVDYVSNQLLAAIPICVQQFRESAGTKCLLLTHACSSASNGVTWGEAIEALRGYWAHDQYEKAIKAPKVHAHTDNRSYEMAFKLRSQIPSQAYYYMTRIIGSKQMAIDAADHVT